MKKWTKEEVALLDQYAYAPMREILSVLPGRDRKTVYWKLSTIGHRRATYERYTLEQDDYIRNNYQKKGNRAIAKELKRTEKSICKRMIVLGLKRSEESLKKMRSENNGCYKKGRVSEKAFFNGQLQLIYDERYDNTFYNIKIDGKFVRFSRYLYEQYHNDKLTADDIVYHLDGNGMNVLKENLVKIKRADLLDKNINSDVAFVKRIFRINDPEEVDFFVKQNPDLLKLKKNIIKLNQKINENGTKISTN